MARLTKHKKNETKEFYYGINRKTFEVEMVSLTRDGVLHKYGKDMDMASHAVVRGRKPETEVTIAFGLTDVIWFPAEMSEAEGARAKIRELQDKAAAMKEAAEQK